MKEALTETLVKKMRAKFPSDDVSVQDIIGEEVVAFMMHSGSVKPAEIRQRDQLLFEFEVEPALQRVKNYGAVTAAACVASFLLFRLASPDSP